MKPRESSSKTETDRFPWNISGEGKLFQTTNISEKMNTVFLGKISGYPHYFSKSTTGSQKPFVSGVQND